MKQEKESFKEFVLREVYAIKIDESQHGLPVLIKFFQNRYSDEPNRKYWFVRLEEDDFMSHHDGLFVYKPGKIYDDEEYSQEEYNRKLNWKEEFTFDNPEQAYQAYDSFYKEKMQFKNTK